MQNEIRNRWTLLKQEAERLGIDNPVIEPSHFEGTWNVIMGEFSFSANSILSAIEVSHTLLNGYEACVNKITDEIEEDVEHWSRECDLAECISVCEGVIEAHGRRNGDTENLARALLLLARSQHE